MSGLVLLFSARKSAPADLESVWRREPGRGLSLTIGVLATAALIGIWWVCTSWTGAVRPLFLPSPESVFARFLKMLTGTYLGKSLFAHVTASLSVVLSGWALGGLIGVPLGVAMAWWSRVRWIVFPVFQLVRPVPPLAWIPLTIIWIGIGDAARIFVVFIAALVPWVLNSMQAVNSIDKLLLDAARTMGANDRQILWRVVMRTALPTLLAGAAIALGNAWTTLVAAELLAATAGLGYVALNAAQNLDTDILLVAMAMVGILGALMSLGMRGAARLIAPWADKGARHG